MGLSDRFRIDELTQKGSKAIERDEGGRIRVRKRNGKERKREILKSKKPYGVEPIRGPRKIKDKFKSDLNEVDITPNVEQTSFAGETSGYIERPAYNEEELKKAVDVKVDELIKSPKKQKGPTVPKRRYDALEGRFASAQSTIRAKTEESRALQGDVSSLQSTINSLQSDVTSANEQVVAKQQELDGLLERYNKLLEDFQNSVIKGTKEGIERVSLTAQVKGLQAQKETLNSQLEAQKQIVATIQQTSETQAELAKQQQEAIKQKAEEDVAQAQANGVQDTISAKGGGAIGNLGWTYKTQTRGGEIEGLQFIDKKKNTKGWLRGQKIELLNAGTEAVTLTVTYRKNKGKQWVNVPRSVRVPGSVNGGATPGKKVLTFKRNGSAGKGQHLGTITFKDGATSRQFEVSTKYDQLYSRRRVGSN